MERPFGRPRPFLATCLLSALISFSTFCEDAHGQDRNQRVVEEAQQFMRGYAVDLLAGNRSSIAERYDRTGAFLVGAGSKQFVPYDSIAAMYAGANWSPPVSFEWQDLSFEPLGPDAAVVVGKFLWGFARDKPPITMSYTALLRRQGGTLRIRVEDESAAPPPPNPEK